MASLNHYSTGAVVQWLFDTMCGIRVKPDNEFTVAPRPGGHFTHARAGYRSVYGLIESGWKKTETGWRFTITVPANCRATVCLPDGSRHRQGPGTQVYPIEEA